MPAHPDISTLIALYLQLPGAPAKPSRRDWAIAHALLLNGLELQTLGAAMILATLRRSLHQGRPALEPVRSLAYYRPLALHLHQNPLDPEYLEYLQLRFRDAFPSFPSPLDPKTAAYRQNPAHRHRR